MGPATTLEGRPLRTTQLTVVASAHYRRRLEYLSAEPADQGQPVKAVERLIGDQQAAPGGWRLFLGPADASGWIELWSGLQRVLVGL